MGTLFEKIFGKKKEKNGEVESIDSVVREVLEGTIRRADIQAGFEIKKEELGENEWNLTVEMQGDDEELLTQKDGQLLDAFQLLVKRVLQHRFPEARVNLVVDSGGFRDGVNQGLIDLVEKLKEVVLEKGKSVYCRALPPKDRKFVHQYVAQDERLRSRSVGEGLYKKIKIYPSKGHERNEEAT